MSQLHRPVVCRLLAGSAAAALVVAGCGSGGGHTAPTTVPTTLRVTTTTTLPPPTQQQLQTVVLVQPSDLPTGWTASPAAVPPYRAADATAFAQCMGIQDTGADVAAAGVSPSYASGSGVINSTATSFANTMDVQIDTAALIDPKASTCYVQVLKARLIASLPKTSIVKTFTLKITPGAGGGPTNVVATSTGTIAYTVSGKTITINFDLVYLVGPRVEAQISFGTTGTAIAAAVKTAVVAKVAARVAATP